MKHVNGPKFGKHTTVIDAAYELMKKVADWDEVNKISLARIDQGLRPAPQRLKITAMKGGLQLQVRGSTSTQKIVIYTDQPDKVERKLKDAF